MLDLHIEYISVGDITPYEKNARKHQDEDLKAIIASVQEFGFDDPIGVWGDKNIIVEGHGRLMAAKALGMKEVPCIRLDHLTDEQRKAYALAHNKTAELSEWDFDLLDGELDDILDIDMSQFGFDLGNDWFERINKDGTARQEGNDKYNAFLDKFEAKKTTDDCYTPDNVYNVIADWVAQEYGVERKHFVRPFYPGGDYQNEKYKDGDIVVDNPPFSILSEIIRFYIDRGIKFFIFAPALTMLNTSSPSCCAVGCGATITYENGAKVATSFLTNLEDVQLRSAPDLRRVIEQADAENGQTESLPNYVYPVEVVTSSMLSAYSKYGVEYSVPYGHACRISALDEQKQEGKGIYGVGYLLAEKERAEKERAEKERAEKERANQRIWKLSEREIELIRSM